MEYMLDLPFIFSFYHFRDKIVTGSFDKTAKVWCTRTGHCLATMWGHDAEVVVAKFSPTRCKLATGSIDATSKIFHIETGIENIAMLSHIIKRAPRFGVIDRRAQRIAVESTSRRSGTSVQNNTRQQLTCSCTPCLFNYCWL